ncbi:hypothetical protein ONS96_013952 [Cadophora gregata f. sp. sojae]|nr:hypothetical protein ONS96_013952 [Cadophora gregata f. sp. sojae]
MESQYSGPEWTTTKLRAVLKSRGLGTKGVKDVLIARLVADDEKDKTGDGDDHQQPIVSEHEQCVMEGQRLSKIHDKDGIQYQYTAAIEILAKHLACNAEYIKVARGTPLDPTVVAVHMSKEFLANVNIPGRWKRFESYSAWTGHFTKDLRDPMLRRAQELFNSLPLEFRSRGVENVLAPASEESTEADALREGIFFYHQVIGKFLETAKQCAHQQYVIARSATLDFLKTLSANQQQILHELYLLQRAEAECRSKTTHLEGMAIRLLDGLLEETGLDAFSTNPTIVAKSNEEAAQKLQELCGFTEDLVLPQFAANPIHRIVAKRTMIANLNPREPVDTNIWATIDLETVDAQLCAALPKAFEEIDRAQFIANFTHLVAITERPASLYTSQGRRKKTPAALHSDKIPAIDLLKDNLYHAHKLLLSLPSDPGNKNCPNKVLPSKTWLRMVALVAIFYGCIAEPGLLVSVSNQLLKDLLAYYDIDPNLYLDTITGNSVGQVLKIEDSANGTNTYCIQAEATVSLEDMEGIHKSRQTIMELARFFRGSIIVAYKITMITNYFDRRPPRTLEDARRGKFESLLPWTRKCALPSCDQPLDLPAEGGYRMLSVGVKDTRMGFPEEREEISQNRLDIYYCLYEFVDSFNWNHNIAPFFFFFAHLYHPGCKPQVGKRAVHE